MIRGRFTSRHGLGRRLAKIASWVEQAVPAHRRRSRAAATSQGVEVAGRSFWVTSGPVGPYDPAVVTVRNEAYWWPFSGVAVLIDGERRGYLAAGKPKTFRVGPGGHTFSVKLGGKRLDHGPMTLGPGERVNLVCARRRSADDARTSWRRFLKSLHRQYDLGPVGRPAAAEPVMSREI